MPVLGHMLSGVMLLRHLGENRAADRMEKAIAAVIDRGQKVTYDLMPDTGDRQPAGTSEVADAVIEELEANNA